MKHGVEGVDVEISLSLRMCPLESFGHSHLVRFEAGRCGRIPWPRQIQARKYRWPTSPRHLCRNAIPFAVAAESSSSIRAEPVDVRYVANSRALPPEGHSFKSIRPVVLHRVSTGSQRRGSIESFRHYLRHASIADVPAAVGDEYSAACVRSCARRAADCERIVAGGQFVAENEFPSGAAKYLPPDKHWVALDETKCVLSTM